VQGLVDHRGNGAFAQQGAAVARQLVEHKLTEHHGRVAELMGDGALVEVASRRGRVCAAAFQAGAVARQAAVPVASGPTMPCRVRDYGVTPGERD
jgi:hypothetical protein